MAGYVAAPGAGPVDMNDPRQVIARSPMRAMQVFIVFLTICLNGLDGFDVASISFASPGISREWGLQPGGLGLVLSMELVGMALGSFFLGGVADKIGRRRTVLGCITVMALGMFIVPMVRNPIELSICRVITGLGIGGMLAAINAVAAEFSNSRRRDLSVSLMSIGYPIGAASGGILASQLLVSYDWRSVFYLGAAATGLLIPVIFFFVPESVHWLAQKQPAGALDKINKTLTRMGHAAVNGLPTLSASARKQSIADIFKPGLIGITMLVTLAYFFHITTFYFILKWVPKIVVDFGFPPSSAGYVLVWTSIGGAFGGAILGLLTIKFGTRALTIGAMVLSTIAVAVFGRTPHDLQMLSAVCAGAGFATNGAIVGLYALFARAFPTHVRATGTGFAIGVGRGGAVLAPIIAGYLFQWNYTLPTVAMTMAAGSVLAGVVLLFLKLSSEDPAPAGNLKGERA